MIEIKSYPAKNGDAFLVKASESPFAMLIDGGYAETFQRHIRSDMENLAASGYALDLVVATHVDADHISGLLSFFRLNGRGEAPATAEIRRLGMVGPLEELDDVFEFLCAHEVADPSEQMLAASDADLEQLYFPDNSVTNGSSISLIAEIEGRRLLFLGDSWADDIVTALTPNGPSIFDAVKISHHGSVRNTSPDLLALVDSPHFFISTNGDSHEHPDFAVLKAIVDRPAKFRRTLHFNYSTPASRRLRSYHSKARADFIVEEDQPDWVAINSPNSND